MIDSKLKFQLISFFESQDGPLYQMWENCDIGRFDGVEWDYPATLRALRDTEISIPDLGEIGDHPALRLYRQLLSTKEV